MDPHQTFLDMFQAMKDEDHATARELALSLQRWFARGGFYTDEYSPEAIHCYLASVLRRTSGHQVHAILSECQAVLLNESLRQRYRQALAPA